VKFQLVAREYQGIKIINLQLKGEGFYEKRIRSQKPSEINLLQCCSSTWIYVKYILKKARSFFCGSLPVAFFELNWLFCLQKT
jgi:hypothetical protein